MDGSNGRIILRNRSPYKDGTLINIGVHLTAYQPPTQLQEVLEQIERESYEPVIGILEQNPHILVSLAVTRSLGEKLPEGLLRRIIRLHSNQQIELVNTAAYHYLLPLVPPATVKRQLALNLAFYKEKLWGNNHLTGIYLPEYAFSPQIVPSLAESGCRWTILDDQPFAWARRHLKEDMRIPYSWIASHSRIACLLRSRYWSERIANGKYSDGNSFVNELISCHEAWIKRSSAAGCHLQDSYIVLGLDLETFGHHPTGPNGPKDAIPRFLLPFFDRVTAEPTRARIMHPGTIVERFRHKESKKYLVAGSWVTQDCHLEENIPFPLWAHPDNEFHTNWNKFMDAALTAIALGKNVNSELAGLTDKAFYSCSPWQFSCGKKEIAAWCLPMFRQIIDCFGDKPIAKELTSLYETLIKLC